MAGDSGSNPHPPESEEFSAACEVGAPLLAWEMGTRQTGDELSRWLWRLETHQVKILAHSPRLQLHPWHPPWSFFSCSRHALEAGILGGAVGSWERGYLCTVHRDPAAERTEARKYGHLA